MIKARFCITDRQYKAAYKNYLTAIEADSTHLDNLWELASYCDDINQQERAIRFYTLALNQVKTESSKASLLMNLGNQFTYHKDYPKAENAYLNSLEIYQRLAKDNPQRYEPDVASTQMNLGNMYSDLNRYSKAENAYSKSLEIYQQLAKINPQQYEPDVAKTQMNLGVMYFSLDEYLKAENAYLNSLEIRQRLAKINPQRFESDVASTQMNLGVMYRNLNDYSKAENAYLNSLEIRQRLAENNPQRYEPDVARTQMNLGVMYYSLNDYPEAEKVYLNSLEIRRRLAKNNPQRFNLDLCETLINFAFLKKELIGKELAWQFKKEGLNIIQEAQAILLQSNIFLPNVKGFKQHADKLEIYFSTITKESLQVQSEINKVLPYKVKNNTEKDAQQKVKNQKNVIDILKTALKTYPNNKQLIEETSNAYGKLAWFDLFTKSFQKAEQAALKGLELDTSQEWIKANLALALLYQGKLEAAKNIYLKLKDKPYGKRTYKAIFFKDLTALEKEGITHQDVAIIRTLLEDS